MGSRPPEHGNEKLFRWGIETPIAATSEDLRLNVRRVTRGPLGEDQSAHAEVARERLGSSKPLDVIRIGDDGLGRSRPDPGNRLEQLHRRITRRDLIESFFGVDDAPSQFVQLLFQPAQHAFADVIQHLRREPGPAGPAPQGLVRTTPSERP